MDCKNCKAELEEQNMICPACGTDNAPEETKGEFLEAVVEEIAEEPTEEIAEETTEETAEEADEEAALLEAESMSETPRKKKWLIPVIAACTAVLLLGGAVFGWWAYNGGSFTPKENDVYYKDNYIARGNKLDKALDTVIATMGERQLTNGEFQVYYWMQVYNFLEYYSSNVNIDLSKPLAEQYVSDNMTWEQYFIDLALATWNRYQALCLAAESESYELPEEIKQTLSQTQENLDAAAEEYEFASAEEMIQADMGPGCSVEDYLKYMNDYYLGVYYFNGIFDQMNPTEEEISAFFDENAEEFETQYGVTKESGKLVDIRHILLAPEDAETDDSGYVVATEEQWEACRAAAQALLDEWKAGEATEEAFAELASKHSLDSGSSSDGGLYSAVPTGYMVENFDAWMFDESRQNGDTGLVKTEFGYHIMYYVSGEEGWLLYGRDALISDLCSKRLDELTKNNSIEVNYKAIVLGQADLESNMQ